MRAESIASYLDGGLSPEERQSFERHLLICPECRQDLAEASDLTEQPRRPWLVRFAPLAAAAAVVALWVGISTRSLPPGAEPVLRGPAITTQMDVVSPPDGATISADSLVFRWRAAAADAHYVFTLTDADGDVVYTSGQPDTTLVLPRSVGLEPGGQYFWVVDGLLDGARSTSSGFQGFVVR